MTPLSDILNGVLGTLMTALVIASIPAGLFGILLFLDALISRLTTPAVYRLTREVDRNQAELAIALFYAPLLSGGSAIVAGFGVNVLTGTDSNTPYFWLGWLTSVIVIALALFLLVRGSLVLLRRTRDGGYWLGNVRHRLQRYSDRDFTPAEQAYALAQIRRVQRVGIRLTERADALTPRRWFARQRARVRRSRWALWLVILSALLFILGTAAAAGIDALSGTVWRIAGLLGVGLLLIPAEVVLRRNIERWWLRSLGGELVSAARRAETVLAHRSPPATGLARVRRWWSRGPLSAGRRGRRRRARRRSARPGR